MTWDGEVSAVSLDAVRDSVVARSATVLDDWDDEFDRGKVRRGAHAMSRGQLGARSGGLDLSGQCEVAAAL